MRFPRLVALLVALHGSLPAAAAELMTLEAKIPLGPVAGRIDHLAVDLDRKRLLVAELGNNTVGVVDLAAGQVVGRITGLKEPQGVAYVKGADLIYVASAGDGTVKMFRAADLAPSGQLKLGDDADNIRLDPGSGQVFVGYGSGALAILDAASGRKTGEIKLAEHPESFQLELRGGRIFVNVPDARRVSVVDRATKREVAQWKLDAQSNFPMALDEAAHRLFVVYRSPPTLAVFDTAQGAVVTQMRTCGDADDVFVDGRRNRIYISCGAGEIAVVQPDGAGYRELGRIATHSGARTSLFVPELDRLYLAVRARAHEPAGIWVFRPEP